MVLFTAAGIAAAASLAAAVPGVVQSISSIFGGDGGMKRADWDIVRANEAQVALLERAAAAQATISAAPAAPVVRRIQTVASVSRPSMGMEERMVVGQDDLAVRPTTDVASDLLWEAHVLKDIIMGVNSLGHGTGWIVSYAKKNHFTYKEFNQLTQMQPLMALIWKSLGLAEQGGVAHEARMRVLRYIDNALYHAQLHKPKKRRVVGIRVMLRALTQAGNLRKKIDKACPPRHGHKVIHTGKK